MTCILCKAFFWFGHIWSRTVMNWPFEFMSNPLYQVYNRAMLKSVELNDSGSCGYWGEPSEPQTGEQ